MQFNLNMLLISLLPSLLALGLWAILLYWGLQSVIDFLQQNFVQTESYHWVGNTLTALGLFALKAFIVPLAAMWLLLPVMVLSALIFVAFIAMPVINRTISKKYFPLLEKKRGASWGNSLGFALWNTLIFLFIWLLSLPLVLFFQLGLIVQPALIGWLTYRVMAYDALAVHASVLERQTIMRQYAWQLWLVGIVASLLSLLPGMIWLGGVFWLLMLPLCAALAIWLYVLIFMFSGIWFQLFCLDVLQQLREHPP
jgi:hypothetical protein